jgi:hypothetical protein
VKEEIDTLQPCSVSVTSVPRVKEDSPPG